LPAAAGGLARTCAAHNSAAQAHVGVFREAATALAAMAAADPGVALLLKDGGKEPQVAREIQARVGWPELQRNILRLLRGRTGAGTCKALVAEVDAAVAGKWGAAGGAAAAAGAGGAGQSTARSAADADAATRALLEVGVPDSSCQFEAC